jgi:hypothetical protein
MNFKPSDKVVCLGSFPLESCEKIGCVVLMGGLPVKDVVYSVREVVPEVMLHDRTISSGLRLVGIHCNKNKTDGKEFSWDSKGFRKLEDIQAENKASQSDDAFLKEALELINTDPESLP